MYTSQRRTSIKKYLQQKGGNKSWIWLQALLQGLIGAILSAGILAAITYCTVLRQVKQNYDLNVANMAFEVLVAKDTSLYPLLTDLLKRVKDKDLKKALEKRIEENPNIPDTMKQQILEIKVNEKMGLSDSLSSFKSVGLTEAPEKPYIGIVCLRDDSISRNKAEEISYLLKSKKLRSVVYFVGNDWYYKDQGKPSSSIVEIRYNSSEKKWGDTIKKILDNEPNLGKFALRQTPASFSAYTIAIVLPDNRR